MACKLDMPAPLQLHFEIHGHYYFNNNYEEARDTALSVVVLLTPNGAYNVYVWYDIN